MTTTQQTLADLYERAAAAGVAGFRRLTRDELVRRLDAQAAPAGEVVAGVLERRRGGDAVVRVDGFGPGADDAVVGAATVRRLGLRPGDRVEVTAAPAAPDARFRSAGEVVAVEGAPPEPAHAGRANWRSLPSVAPARPFTADAPDGARARAALALAPHLHGSRALVGGPAWAVSATLREVAAALAGEARVVAIVAGAPAERLAGWAALEGVEVAGSGVDDAAGVAEVAVAAAGLAVERAVRLLEAGHEVVVVVDSAATLARLADRTADRAARLGDPTLDAGALDLVRMLFAVARDTGDGGSLTVVAGLPDDGPAAAVVRAELSPFAGATVELDALARVDPGLTGAEAPVVGAGAPPDAALDVSRLRAALAKADDPSAELEARAERAASTEDLRRAGARRRR